MVNKAKIIDLKTTQPRNTLYKFTLKGDTGFQGQFSQRFIKVHPAYLNGKPIELAVAMITRIQRVNDPGWRISRKLMYFIFELTDGSKIAGLPNDKEFSVNTIFSKDCQVEFESILEVEKA